MHKTRQLSLGLSASKLVAQLAVQPSIFFHTVGMHTHNSQQLQ